MQAPLALTTSPGLRLYEHRYSTLEVIAVILYSYEMNNSAIVVNWTQRSKNGESRSAGDVREDVHNTSCQEISWMTSEALVLSV
jgi:hypothetical protein